MRPVDKTCAGPSLRALAAAAIGHLWIRLDIGGEPNDYSLSGTWKGEVDELTLVRSNVISVEPPEIHSRVTWELTHRSWALTFIERRRFADGRFGRSAPYQVTLNGDLLEAARFLNIPREVFFEGLRADGWTPASITLEQLRWLDVVPCEPKDFRFVMQSL
jgi:hypothetical protein